MKILMVARSNFYKLGGGDKTQLLKTKSALEARGHNLTVTTCYIADLSEYDVIHLFNMMIAPHSFTLWVRHAHRQSKPIALSTIYWNPTEWLAHEPEERISRIKTIMNHLRYPFKGIPLVVAMEFVRHDEVLGQWFRLFVSSPGGGKASSYIRRYLVQNADIILPNGQKEVEAVEQDFGKAKLSMSVPNGVDDDFKDAKASDFVSKYHLKDFVLHVGRIETRKNLVALAAAVRQLGLPFVLIGNSTLNPKYTRAVKKTAGLKAIFIDELPYAELGSAYKAAKVHVLASWFETPGLSSLEAALAGCNIVSTDRGTTKEYFANLARYCDPTNQVSIKTAVKAAYAAPRSTKLRARMLQKYMWSDTAEVTEKAYLRITGQL